MSAGQLALELGLDWPGSARRYIDSLPPGDLFTADSLRRAVGEPPDPNMLGGVIQQASRKHLIRYDGRDWRTVRPAARGRFNRVWVRNGVPQ